MVVLTEPGYASREKAELANLSRLPAIWVNAVNGHGLGGPAVVTRPKKRKIFVFE